MEEKDLKTITRSIDWLASVGERALARKVAFKVLLHLRSATEEKSESVREIESALKKEYAGNLSVREPSEGQPRNRYRDVLVETSLKTVVVLLTLFLVVSVAALFLNVGEKHYRMISKIERGDDRKWNQYEAAISRNPYLYYRAALIYEERGEIENAIFQMEKALSLAPRNEQYRKKLDQLVETLQADKDSSSDRN